MAKKIKLEHLYNYDDLNIIGINASMPDYQLIWHLNNTLAYNLIKKEDFIFEMLKTAEKLPFSYYQYHDLNNNKWVYLLSNKSLNKNLITEYRSFNFLLIIKGMAADTLVADMSSQLKSIKNVIMTSKLDLKKIKNLDVIFNDFELFTIEINKKKK